MTIPRKDFTSLGVLKGVGKVLARSKRFFAAVIPIVVSMCPRKETLVVTNLHLESLT